jgi:adenylate cyclase
VPARRSAPAGPETDSTFASPLETATILRYGPSNMIAFGPFSLEDKFTLSVVSAIEPRLRQAEILCATRKRPGTLDAYDLYLRALPHTQDRRAERRWKTLEWLHWVAVLERTMRPRLRWRLGEMGYLPGGMHEADKIAET